MPSTYNGVPNNTAPCWWNDPSLRRNVLWVSITAMTQVVGGYDGSLLNALQAVPKLFEQFPELHDSNILGITGATLFLPGLIVPFAAAWLTDKIGRKIPMIVGVVVIIAGAIIQAVSSSIGQFIAGRAVMGIGSAVGAVASISLCAEVCHPRYRAKATSMQISVYYVGSILSSWTTYGSLQQMGGSSWSWRLPVLLQCLFPAIMLAFLFFIPESPRWYVAKGRDDEARKVFAKEHANGDENDALVNLEMEEVRAALVAEREQSASWKALWATKGNRWRMFIVINTAAGAQLNGVGIVSYYLVPVLRSVGIESYLSQSLISGGLAISNLFFAIAGAMAVERVGRRKLWLTSTGMMLVTLAITTALSATFVNNPSPAIGGATIAFLYLFYAGYDLAWSPLNVAYTVEVLPFTIRAKGLAVWQGVTSITLCINTWVNPVALSAIQWKYYFVYISILIYLVVAIWFLYPETRGRTLEETAEVFDGADALSSATHVEDAETGSIQKKDGVVMLENSGDVQQLSK